VTEEDAGVSKTLPIVWAQSNVCCGAWITMTMRCATVLQLQPLPLISLTAARWTWTGGNHTIHPHSCANLVPMTASVRAGSHQLHLLIPRIQ
jgi:hypothetical protein